ncbi:MAG: alpha/beta fold hydrolase [Myxococcota bacterium]
MKNAPLPSTSSTSPPSSARVRSAGASTPAWLDAFLYPFVSREHATPDGVVRYVDEGRGRPILLVHGTPSWSFEWRASIAALAVEHRVIAPDHLGFGLSDKPPGAPYRPVDHARRLASLVEALDLRDVTLVVHDFGGPIGLTWAAGASERVRDIVVLNSWAWSVADRRAARISRLVRSPLGRFLYLWLNASPRWLVPASFGDKRRLTRAAHHHYLAPFGRRSERRAPWALGVALAGEAASFEALWSARGRWIDKLRAIVWGMRDPALRPDLLARWREAAPWARVIELADVGHFRRRRRPRP